MVKAAPLFLKETDLCAAFLEAVDKEAWTAYAETAGWDILLVRKADGLQVGIQAKLRMNIDVVNQAIEDFHNATRAGPDCRAVLVPAPNPGFDAVCAYIGLTVIVVYSRQHYSWQEKATKRRWEFAPPLPEMKNSWREYWHEWCPTKRHNLPEYVPDVTAGASAPLQLTDWKISAIKIAVTIEQRGYVTREDFKHIGIDHRRWLHPNSWLTIDERGRYIAGRMPNFKKQHPKVYKEIAADAPKWMRKESPTLV